MGKPEGNGGEQNEAPYTLMFGRNKAYQVHGGYQRGEGGKGRDEQCCEAMLGTLYIFTTYL